MEIGDKVKVVKSTYIKYKMIGHTGKIIHKWDKKTDDKGNVLRHQDEFAVRFESGNTYLFVEEELKKI